MTMYNGNMQWLSYDGDDDDYDNVDDGYVWTSKCQFVIVHWISYIELITNPGQCII